MVDWEIKTDLSVFPKRIVLKHVKGKITDVYAWKDKDKSIIVLGEKGKDFMLFFVVKGDFEVPERVNEEGKLEFFITDGINEVIKFLKDLGFEVVIVEDKSFEMVAKVLKKTAWALRDVLEKHLEDAKVYKDMECIEELRDLACELEDIFFGIAAEMYETLREMEKDT